MRFEILARDAGARLGRLETAPRDDRHPGLHAGRHARCGQGADAAGARGDRERRSCSRTSTTSLCGRASRPSARRRAAPLHRLEPADPDRQRGFPGLLPRGAAQGRRARRALPQPSRRRACSSSPRRASSRRRRAIGVDIAMVLDECPPWPVTEPVAAAALARTLRWAERSIAARTTGGHRALRHRPGQQLSAPARGGGGGARRAPVRRLRDRRGERRRAARAPPGGDRMDRALPAGGPRALPHGGRERFPTCCTRSPTASICSTACCRRGTAATACSTPARGRCGSRTPRFRDDAATARPRVRLPGLQPAVARPFCTTSSAPASSPRRSTAPCTICAYSLTSWGKREKLLRLFG